MNAVTQDAAKRRWPSRFRNLSDRQWTLSIVGFAILFRLAAALVWQYQCNQAGVTLRFGDSNSYWVIARNLAVDGEYQYGSDQSKIFRAPVYPLFLSIFAWCEHFNGKQVAQMPFVLAARFAGCIFGGFVVWLMMRWTKEVAGAIAGRSAGLLAATYSGAVGMSIFVLSEAVATPLMLLSVWLLWRSTREMDQQSRTRYLAWSAGSAISLGLACLARPSWGLWPAIAFPCLVIASKACGGGCWRRWGLNAGFFFLILCLVMSPWWLRNYSVTGKFVPTTLQVGASLYDGWHPGASGSSDENMEFSMETMRRIVQEEALLSNDGEAKPDLESTLEWRIDRRLRDEAWAWARENPSDALRLGLVKFRKTWAPVPQAQELSNPLVKWWEAASYLLILCMSAIGLHRILGDRKWVDACSMALPCVYLAILHMVFIGSVRYRQPGVLVLCGLAGIGMAVVWSQLGRWNRTEQDRKRKDAVGNANEPKE